MSEFIKDSGSLGKFFAKFIDMEFPREMFINKNT